LGIGLIVSTVYIFFKDIDQVWTIVNLVIFWTSPLFARGDMIAQKIPFLPYVNPVFGIMQNFRAVVIQGVMPNFFFLAYNFLYAFVVMYIGLYLFKKYAHKAVEKTL